jgi:hypothetical protein
MCCIVGAVIRTDNFLVVAKLFWSSKRYKRKGTEE